VSARPAEDSAFEESWHAQVARNSLERWRKICQQEQWTDIPSNLPLLIKIFGASWYFTRFIFVNGAAVVKLLDDPDIPPFDRDYFNHSLAPALECAGTGHDDFEAGVNRLRSLKNTCMLRLLACYLNRDIGIEQLEHALTVLAESTLAVLVKLIGALPQHREFPVTILGMGRLAGYEMTFGSDLDLIFLHEQGAEDLHQKLGRTVRLLLRTVAQPASAGLLYEVDMRLRPHGNSGPLLTSYGTFREYHDGRRDVWEKQMMTRSRPIFVSSREVDRVLEYVRASIYTASEEGYLRQEILNMRMRVQKELGSPRRRYEIKRGYGGIMDIDFISHYYQLAYGHEHSALQTTGTRATLREAAGLSLLGNDIAGKLLASYDYLKRVEMCLRLFDLKAIDSFTIDGEDNLPLARAMGHGDNRDSFLSEFESVTHGVRACFREVMGAAEEAG